MFRITMRAQLFYLIFVAATLFALSGCSQIQIARPTERIVKPSAGKALVTIVRPRIFLGKGLEIAVFDSEKFVGLLKSGSLIQYETEPGEHYFFSGGTNQATNVSIIKADLAADREYLIILKMAAGFMRAHPYLDPVTREENFDAGLIDTWKVGLTPLGVIEQNRKAFMANNEYIVNRAMQSIQNEKDDYARLNKNDNI